MKKIVAERKKHFYKFVVNSLLIFIFHYVAFIIYVLLFRIYSIMVSGEFVNNLNAWSYLIYYYILVGPGINAFMHIYYLKTGSLSARAVMWLNTLILIIAMPSLTLFV